MNTLTAVSCDLCTALIEGEQGSTGRKLCAGHIPCTKKKEYPIYSFMGFLVNKYVNQPCILNLFTGSPATTVT